MSLLNGDKEFPCDGYCTSGYTVIWRWRAQRKSNFNELGNSNPTSETVYYGNEIGRGNDSWVTMLLNMISSHDVQNDSFLVWMLQTSCYGMLKAVPMFSSQSIWSTSFQRIRKGKEEQSGWSLYWVPFAALDAVPGPKIHFLPQKWALSYTKLVAWDIRPWGTGQRKFTIDCWYQTGSRNRDNGVFLLRIGLFQFKFHNFVFHI